MALASVVTPTKDRQDLLFNRCIPSVRAQTYEGPIEHVVVSDADPELRARMRWEHPEIRFCEINGLWRNPESERSIGAWPWFIGCNMALGDFVFFLSDDNEMLPQHIAAHIGAMEAESTDFAISVVEFKVGGQHRMFVGDGRMEVCHMDADGISCRTECLRQANWQADGSSAPDFELALRWNQLGLRHSFVNEVTAIHHDGWAAR